MSTTVAYNVAMLTPEEASHLFSTEWWVNQPAEEAAKRQLFTNLIVMPLDKFHAGLKNVLGRDVDREEIYHKEILRAEYLGLKTKPSAQELAELKTKPIEVMQFVSGVIDERE